MFEIGNSLREARLRQGLDLPRAEADTKIRAKYLQALEAERFEVLPAETYVKGFLRTYAEYLGLDGQVYVDEYNSRFASAEEPPLTSGPPRRAHSRPAESSLVVVALAGIVAVTVLVVVAFGFSSDRSDPGAATSTPRTDTGPAAGTGAGGTPAGQADRSKPKPARARLALAAAGGDCWVRVVTGSPDGELLFEGTIAEGDLKRFAGRRLWVTVGAPEYLQATLNGRRLSQEKFPQAEPVIVSAKGVQPQL